MANTQTTMRTTNFGLRSGRRALLAGMTAGLIALLSGCGGGGGGNPGGNTSASNTVIGTVRNSAAQDIAVGGATVTIGTTTGTTPTTAQASATNKVGTFSLSNVAVGTSTAQVVFQNTRQTAAGVSQTFTDTQIIAFTPPVSPGTNAPIDLFVNIGQVTGRVLLPSGAPAAGAYVTLVATGDPVQADAKGYFLFLNVPKGVTQVSAVLGTQSVVQGVTVGNGLVAIPDMKLVDNPNPNPPGVPSDIVGKVSAASGPLAGANVLLSRSGVQIEQATTSADGTYSFYVPAGDYSVTVLQDGFQNGTAAGTVSNPNVALALNVTLVAR